MDLHTILLQATKIREERKWAMEAAKRNSSLAQKVAKEHDQAKEELGSAQMKVSDMGEHNQWLSHLR